MWPFHVSFATIHVHTSHEWPYEVEMFVAAVIRTTYSGNQDVIWFVRQSINRWTGDQVDFEWRHIGWVTVKVIATVFETEYIKESRGIRKEECHFRSKANPSSHVVLFSNMSDTFDHHCGKSWRPIIGWAFGNTRQATRFWTSRSQHVKAQLLIHPLFSSQPTIPCLTRHPLKKAWASF